MRTLLLRLSTVLASMLLAACAITPPPAAPGAAQAKAELLWLGQSTFRLTTPAARSS